MVFNRVLCLVVVVLLIQQSCILEIEAVNETEAKKQMCEVILSDQVKMPQKYQRFYEHIRTLCEDGSKSNEAVWNYFITNMTEDDRTEIQTYQIGKDGFRNYFTSLTRFWRKSDNKQILKDAVNEPEYQDVLSICQDDSKTIDDLIPFVLTFSKLYILT